MSILSKLRKKGLLDDLPPLTESEQQNADSHRRHKAFMKSEQGRAEVERTEKDNRKVKEMLALGAKLREEYEVLCIDDTGKGDLFDEGLTYIAKGCELKFLIRVCDRNGEWQECIESRFERVPAGE